MLLVNRFVNSFVNPFVICVVNPFVIAFVSIFVIWFVNASANAFAISFVNPLDPPPQPPIPLGAFIGISEVGGVNPSRIPQPGNRVSCLCLRCVRACVRASEDLREGFG